MGSFVWGCYGEALHSMAEPHQCRVLLLFAIGGAATWVLV
jgi:hypothetical protein